VVVGQNVLIDQERDDMLRAKITDFGLTKFAPRVLQKPSVSFNSALASHNLTSFSKKKMHSCTFVDCTYEHGTIRYMAPEVLEVNAARVDHCPKTYSYVDSSDVWSFALIMWQLLELKEIWPDLLRYKVDDKYRAGERPPISLSKTKTPTNMRYIRLMKGCWDQNPVCRPRFSVILRRIRIFQGLCQEQKSSGILSEPNGNRNKTLRVTNSQASKISGLAMSDVTRPSELHPYFRFSMDEKYRSTPQEELLLITR